MEVFSNESLNNTTDCQEECDDKSGEKKHLSYQGQKSPRNQRELLEPGFCLPNFLGMIDSGLQLVTELFQLPDARDKVYQGDGNEE